MFKGSITALITPFRDDVVDTYQLRELVEFHISSGTHGLVAAGTTGESGTLSLDEKLLVIKTVIEQVRERIPVIAGTAANATKDCIKLTQLAMECGAHAALIMTPAYIKPTQEGLYQHYSDIAAQVPIPIILYNVPSRTSCDMLPETVNRLAKISNIVGIKEAVAQLDRLQELMRLTAGSIDIFSGDDETAAEWILAGAKGVISVAANIVPRQMAKMADLALDGDKEACLAIHESLLPLYKMLFVEANPIPVKWAMSYLGLSKNELRKPLMPLSPEYHGAFLQIMQSIA